MRAGDPGLLSRFLPLLEEGTVSAWLAAHIPAGSWLLDPFGFSPRLALEAAASRLGIARLAVYEPPFVADGATRAAGHQAQLEQLIAAGRRGAAVRYFMRQMVGVPAPLVLLMRLMPRTWRKLTAVAHTLPYDAAVMGDFAPPTERLASIAVPTLAMHGEKTDARLRRAARAVAEAVPNSRHQALPGQNHAVKPEVLAPALEEFFAA